MARPAALVAAAISIGIMGCTTEFGGALPTDTDSAAADAAVIDHGTGDFTFEGSGELAGHPVRVWYEAPAGDLETADILVVMTGAQRNGEDYRSAWAPQLAGSNTILLVPEFSVEEYPGVSAYNLGGMLDRRDDLLPRDSWSFNVIEELFDHVVEELGSTQTDYALFGHSAGAQFVHRFVEFMPDSRARIVVAANAGWYTVLDDRVDFPYGLRDAPLGIEEMETAFSRELIILVGADDIDPEDGSLQRDKDTDKQGKNRLARGLNFYQTARDAAGSFMPFNWRLIAIPGIAHSYERMAKAAAPLLLNPG